MGIMETKEQNDYRYESARKRIKAIKNFYIHLAAFVFVNGFILILNTRHQGIVEYIMEEDTLRNLVLWGSLLFIHWAVVFGATLLLGKDWERRKLQALMEKEKQRWE